MKLVFKFMIFIFLVYITSCKKNKHNTDIVYLNNTECSDDILYQYLFKANIKPYLESELCDDCYYYIVAKGEDKKYYMIKIKILKFLYLDFVKNNEIDYENFICDLISGKIELKLSEYASHSAIEIHELFLHEEVQDKLNSNDLSNLEKEFGIEKVEFIYNLDLDSPYQDDFIYFFFNKGYLYTENQASSYTFTSIEKLMEYYDNQ